MKKCLWWLRHCITWKSYFKRKNNLWIVKYKKYKKKKKIKKKKKKKKKDNGDARNIFNSSFIYGCNESYH